MKTTIEIADELFNRARKRAQRDQTTLRALVEEGLRRVLRAPPETTTEPFEFPVFGGGDPSRAPSGPAVTQMIHDDYEERDDKALRTAESGVDRG